ncbi:methyl-accepting chemotaxis protein [Leptospira sp. GIMC2001]|uniref:methyl-accepting chemotaxis protein n=1 Tax=Leptospira sp. GIMC2001 TaxID=1513297 RepID=UPI00234B34E3|nr:methyl-accepting chemotaxis protein [Leptospira sp. GIMC2001]WCL50456.1 methyl-accepting chemotaxis protein [Leptospira sp. GIMC2001]
MNIDFFILRLCLRLEAQTYALTLPTATIFVIIAGGYVGERLISLILGIIIAIILTISIPIYRYFWLKKRLTAFQSNNQFELRSTMKHLLNFPRIEMRFVTIQWIFGIILSSIILNHFGKMQNHEIVVSIFLFFMIFGINASSHYLAAEIECIELLSQEEFSKIKIDSSELRLVSIKQKTLFMIISILLMPLFSLSYLLIVNKIFPDFNNPYPVEYSLPFFIIFIILTSYLGIRLLIKSIEFNVNSLASIINNIAQGNTNCTMPIISLDELGHISFSMNQFIAKFRTVILAIDNQSKNLFEQSTSLVKAASDLNRITTEQASAYEEMSANLEVITLSSNEVSEQAKKQLDISLESSRALENLNLSVESARNESINAKNISDIVKVQLQVNSEKIKNTLAFMNDIQESTHKISSILIIIHEISEQIGLLSLNASIEAARAGEHGKGFAIVAREISKLGENTSSNASQISQFVKQAVSNAKQGMTSIQDAANSFGLMEEKIKETILRINTISDLTENQIEISKAVLNQFNEVNLLAQEIRSSTVEQSESNLEVSTSIQNLSIETQNLAINSELTHSISKEFKQQSIDLQKELSYFEIH